MGKRNLARVAQGQAGGWVPVCVASAAEKARVFRAAHARDRAPGRKAFLRRAAARHPDRAIGITGTAIPVNFRV